MKDQKKVKIKITERESDHHACINNLQGVWGCGENKFEAIGQMIFFHPEKFGVEFIEQ